MQTFVQKKICVAYFMEPRFCRNFPVCVEFLVQESLRTVLYHGIRTCSKHVRCTCRHQAKSQSLPEANHVLGSDFSHANGSNIKKDATRPRVGPSMNC
jgi:hypothetical protein